jgi:hypothetical protein
MEELGNSCGVEMLYPSATCDVRALTKLSRTPKHIFKLWGIDHIFALEFWSCSPKIATKTYLNMIKSGVLYILVYLFILWSFLSSVGYVVLIVRMVMDFSFVKTRKKKPKLISNLCCVDYIFCSGILNCFSAKIATKTYLDVHKWGILYYIYIYIYLFIHWSFFSVYRLCRFDCKNDYGLLFSKDAKEVAGSCFQVLSHG